ncbi:MAG TPA: PAS domain-containing protein, partial [Longimicrobiales bacterium]
MRLHALLRGLARRERVDAAAEELVRRSAALEQENAALREQLRTAEEARREGEARCRRGVQVLGSIADAFFALDDTGCVVHINPAAEALFTVRRGEVLGRSVWRSFRLGGTGLERALHEAMRTRDVVRLEEYFRGGFYAVAVYPSAEGVSVLLTDVTASRAVEARFRAMAEAMPQMVWSAGRDGRLDYCNARFLAYSGAPSALPEGAVWDAVHPDDAPRIQAAWRQALKSGAPYELSLRIRDAAAGSYRWFLARAVPVQGLNGEVLRWVGTCTDVHEERSRATLVRMLFEFSEALSAAATVEEVGRAACDWGRRVLGAEHSITALLTDDGQALLPVAAIGVGEAFLGRILPLDVPGAICAAVRTDSVVWA